MNSQRDQILAHLERHGRITPLEALDRYGCFRLGARVYELREAGVNIDTKRKEVKTRRGSKSVVAEYRLVG